MQKIALVASTSVEASILCSVISTLYRSIPSIRVPTSSFGPMSVIWLIMQITCLLATHIALLLGGLITHHIHQAVLGKPIQVYVTPLRSLPRPTFMDFVNALSAPVVTDTTRPRLGNIDKLLARRWNPLLSYFKIMETMRIRDDEQPRFETLRQYRLYQQNRHQISIPPKIKGFKIKEKYLRRLAKYFVPHNGYSPASHLYECLLHFLRAYGSQIKRFIDHPESLQALRRYREQCHYRSPAGTLSLPTHADTVQIALGIDAEIRKWNTPKIVRFLNLSNAILKGFSSGLT